MCYLLKLSMTLIINIVPLLPTDSCRKVQSCVDILSQPIITKPSKCPSLSSASKVFNDKHGVTRYGVMIDMTVG